MPDVDEWVFAEAIRLLRQHVTLFASIPDFRISLNVSPAILCTHDYAAISLNRIKAARISAEVAS